MSSGKWFVVWCALQIRLPHPGQRSMIHGIAGGAEGILHGIASAEGIERGKLSLGDSLARLSARACKIGQAGVRRLAVGGGDG